MNEVLPATTPTTDLNAQQPEPIISQTLPPSQAISNLPQPTTDPSFAIEPKGNKDKKWIWLVVALVVALTLAGYFFWQNNQLSADQINSYSTCLASQGNIIIENNSTICIASDGREFVKPEPEAITPSEVSDGSVYMATIQEVNGRVEYLEPMLGYAFSYPIDPNYTIEDCGNSRIVMYQPDNIPPNSDEPCGSHGVPGLGVSGFISNNFMRENPFCTQKEGSSWTAELVTKTTQSKEVLFCKRQFIGERLYPGPDEFWETYLSKEDVVVRIYVDDLELSELFYEILSTFELTNTSNISPSERAYCDVVTPTPAETKTPLHSYCAGEYCHNADTRDLCEQVDMVSISTGKLTEGSDGTIDCVWNTDSNACTTKYK